MATITLKQLHSKFSAHKTASSHNINQLDAESRRFQRRVSDLEQTMIERNRTVDLM